MCKAFRCLALFWYWVTWNLLSQFTVMWQKIQEFAILVDTKLFAELSLYQVGFAAELSSLLGHFLAVAVKLNVIGMNLLRKVC